MKTLLICCFSILLVLNVQARDIVVLGLFKNTVILKVDGKQYTLKKNRSGPEGIRLISADSDSAVLEVDGKQQTFPLGQHVSSSFRQQKKAQARILPINGMYPVTGFINGQQVSFLVDTGATWISMNTHHARQLGIEFRLSGTRAVVSTANGKVPVYRVLLNKVRVGEIELKRVEAAIIEGRTLPQILLGNSFLNRVEMQRQGQVLLLRQKF